MKLPLLLAGLPMFAAGVSTPVEVQHEKGRFSGQMSLLLEGTSNKAKASWEGSIRNVSGHDIFSASLCIEAFDKDGKQIYAGNDACVIRLWGNNWKDGTSLSWQRTQNVRLTTEKSKAPVQATRFRVQALEVFDLSPNQREIAAKCSFVWTAALRVFADRKFRPTVLQKDSLTATYAFDGGRVDTGSVNFLRAYTNAYTGWTNTWESFRIDAASMYLRDEKLQRCSAEIKMTYAAFGKPLFGQYQWFAVNSNFNLEKEIMNEIEAQAKRAVDTDMDHAISQLPTEAPPPPKAAGAGDSLAAQLEKLADLKARGILTEEEFAAAKAKLLQ